MLYLIGIIYLYIAIIIVMLTLIVLYIINFYSNTHSLRVNGHDNTSLLYVSLRYNNILSISGLSKQGSCASLGKVYTKTAFTNLSFAKRFNNHHEVTNLS